MGTYTTNKNLFMPSVGEQGWGTLVNGNFETIDNFLKPITVSGSTYTFTGNQSGGTISATSISNSGTLTQTGTSTFTGKITGNGGIGTTSLTTSSTITSTGKITGNGGIGTTSLTTSSTITSTGLITANGGVKGNVTGDVTGNCYGRLYIKGEVQTSGDYQYSNCAVQTLSVTSTSSSSPNTLKINGSNITFGNPQRVTHGVYCRRSDLSGSTSAPISTRTATLTLAHSGSSSYDQYGEMYYKNSTESSWTKWSESYIGKGGSRTETVTLTVGATYQFYKGGAANASISVAEGTKYYVKYD